MPISNKATTFAIKTEVTEGSIIEPDSGTCFIPIQSDLEMAPEVEKLDNEELKNSLGMAKKITGAENPTASFSHYIKHSGVEGQAPAYSPLIKSIFGGQRVAGSELATVAGSTTTAIKVADASLFSIGDTILIKDATNGYSIGVIHAIDTLLDTLTLGFKINVAPAAAVSLGKSVTFYPINTANHPSLTLWRYIGGDGAIDMVRGAKVTEMSFTAEAGQLINGSFSLEALEYYWNPIKIEASTNTIDFEDDDGVSSAVVASGWYKTPQELASAIETAISNATTQTITVKYSNQTGKFTIATSTSALLSLPWITGANAATSIGLVIGFDTGADDTGATSYEGDNAQVLSAPFTPTFDDSDPISAKGHLVYFGDQEDNVCFGASSVEITVSNERKTIDNICSESGRSGSVITGRTVTAAVTGLLNKYDSDKIDRLLQNKDCRFMYVGGTKTGGNWTPGKCFSFYMPYCSVDSYTVGDDDSLTTVEFEVSAFVPDDGSLEVFMGFV
jgi:hypothetical protein